MENIRKELSQLEQLIDDNKSAETNLLRDVMANDQIGNAYEELKEENEILLSMNEIQMIRGRYPSLSQPPVFFT
jgi:hypothetical protein